MAHKNKQSFNYRRFFLAVLLPLGILGWLLWLPRHVVINISKSMPLGLYWKDHTPTSIKVGDIVEACLSNHIAHMGLQAGYLVGSNRCGNGAAPVVKQVIAVPDQQVTLTPLTISIDHIVYHAPQQRDVITDQPIVRTVRYGTRIAHGYWLYGRSSPNWSWDSRYWGSVALQQIQAKLTPIWIQHKRGHADE